MSESLSMFADPTPSAPVLTDPDVHPGFGRVALCRDGVEVLTDPTGDKQLDVYTRWVTRATRPHEPTSVWTLHIDAPFVSTIYAYTKDGWTLIETKDGFA